jgi:hypothetical protein
MFKKICDLNKGDRVILNYGDQNGDIATCGDFKGLMRAMLTAPSFHPWEAIVMSKPRGKNPTVVFLEVHGWEKDLGDTYAHKIVGWFNAESGTWEPIEHTPKQKECEEMERTMFGGN